jgi:magnesium chelatase subunit D
VLRSHARKDDVERGASGRRDRSLVALRRGKYSRHRLFRPRDVDVAVDATLRAASARSGRAGTRLDVRREDLRRKVRKHRVPYDVCFVVDNSYSLRAEDLVETVKGLAFRLLEDATGRGDRVALVAFRSGVGEATVALRPTRSRSLAGRALADIPLSGRTPLPDALRISARLLRQERAKRPNARPLTVVVTDGLPNVPLRPGGDAVADSLHQCRALWRAGVGVVVVDAVPRRDAHTGCGEQLADAARGAYLRIEDVTPDALARFLERAQ